MEELSMFICKYLLIGLAYTVLVVSVFLLAEGKDFVEETFLDLSGWIVLTINTVAWPIMLGLSIWKFLKSR